MLAVHAENFPPNVAVTPEFGRNNCQPEFGRNSCQPELAGTQYVFFISLFIFRQQVCELKSDGEKEKIKQRGYSTKKRPRPSQK